MSRPVSLLPPLLLLLGFAPAPFPKPDTGKEDLHRMQGGWVMAWSQKDGVKTLAEQEAVWLIAGNQLTTSLAGKKVGAFSIALDGRKKPSTIDVLSPDGSGSPVPGRYSLEGDLLKVSLGEPRPPDLSGKSPSITPACGSSSGGNREARQSRLPCPPSG
jgi:uncharacterized protein (TIGR03067 family)